MDKDHETTPSGPFDYVNYSCYDLPIPHESIYTGKLSVPNTRKGKGPSRFRISNTEYEHPRLYQVFSYSLIISIILSNEEGRKVKDVTSERVPLKETLWEHDNRLP